MSDTAEPAITEPPRSIAMSLGVVLQKRPGVTRWARHAWHPVAVLPGAPQADWKLLRQEGDVLDYHAATRKLTLYRTDAEAYKVSLSMTPPAVFVVLRRCESGPHEVEVHVVTASAYEAQDYTDSGEEIVEPVPMPPGLVAWVREFCDSHYSEEAFVKRRRDRQRIDAREDGVGDARIRQTADVYRAPGAQKPRVP